MWQQHISTFLLSHDRVSFRRYILIQKRCSPNARLQGRGLQTIFTRSTSRKMTSSMRPYAWRSARSSQVSATVLLSYLSTLTISCFIYSQRSESLCCQRVEPSTLYQPSTFNADVQLCVLPILCCQYVFYYVCRRSHHAERRQNFESACVTSREGHRGKYNYIFKQYLLVPVSHPVDVTHTKYNIYCIDIQ